MVRLFCEQIHKSDIKWVKAEMIAVESILKKFSDILIAHSILYIARIWISWKVARCENIDLSRFFSDQLIQV